MRIGHGAMAVLTLCGLAHPGWAQLTGPELLSRLGPQSVEFKPIDTSAAVKPPAPILDQFSFRRLFSKVVPGLSPTGGPIIPSTVTSLSWLTNLNPFRASTPTYTFPAQVSGPLAPLPPTTVLPGAYSSPFVPALPTTVLPPPLNSPFKPLPPIKPG